MREGEEKILDIRDYLSGKGIPSSLFLKVVTQTSQLAQTSTKVATSVDQSEKERIQLQHLMRQDCEVNVSKNYDKTLGNRAFGSLSREEIIAYDKIPLAMKNAEEFIRKKEGSNEVLENNFNS